MTYFFILFGMREEMACFELCSSSVVKQIADIWNFYGSLTLNKWKLICYCGSLLYVIVLNMTYVFSLFGMREEIAYFEPWFSSELMQNEDIWNFHGSPTLNKGKLI